MPVPVIPEATLASSDFVADKRQRTCAGEEGIEYRRIHAERDLLHKNDTSHEQTINESNSRLTRPIPRRKTFAADCSTPQNVIRFQELYNGDVSLYASQPPGFLPYAHSNRTSASMLFDLGSANRPTERPDTISMNTGRIEAESQNQMMVYSSAPIALQENAWSNAGVVSFNTVPNTHSLPSPTDSSAYADPTVYSIATTTSDESRPHIVGSTGTPTSSNHVPVAAANTFSSVPIYHVSLYGTPTIGYPANSTINHTGTFMTEGHAPFTRYRDADQVGNVAPEQYQNNARRFPQQTAPQVYQRPSTSQYPPTPSEIREVRMSPSGFDE
ncbi:hypothetical protein AAF712_009765 [Marasmius tenuissimus]|uniref:Uncharacterized protein n=1 Tax=Marasmius tenuissimus TaxID=585030 RepID=A0ABR2ZPY8_9AGAR